jgi:formylglycine-generating enzyme required for sulfatase activity
MKRKSVCLAFILFLSACVCSRDSLKSFSIQNLVFEDAALAGIIAKDNQDVPMVFVPAGTFIMGIDLDRATEGCEQRLSADYPDIECRPSLFYPQTPPHQVVLDSFWIDQFEVSYEQYTICVQAGICDASYGDVRLFSEDERLPFTPTFEQAVIFCEWRNARLPTEEEWEYAARGPYGLLYPWGNEFRGDYTNACDVNCSFSGSTFWDDESDRATPVGSYETDKSWVNAYDMLGNVSEWVDGTFEPYDNYEHASPDDPWFSPGLFIVRGGDFLTLYDSLSNTYRFGIEFAFGDVGFRCARTPDVQMPIPTIELAQ